MNENVLKFKEFAEKNPEIMKKVKAAKSTEEVIALAAENGFSIEESDLTPAAAGELSFDELDSVAGGYEYCSDLAGDLCESVLAVSVW